MLFEKMKKIRSIINYFSTFEILLYLLSVLLISAPFFVFDGSDPISLISSLLGVTSLIFIAKGNPIGEILSLIFSVFYGIISFGYAYYGEMLTYLCMTAPMSLLSLISWIKNPYNGNRSEVKINSNIKKAEYLFMALLTLAVTAVFYFILSALNTANIIPSTISVATSFAAVYLTFRRSSYYALAYACNDIVLIVLWSLASVEDIGYASVVFCFVAFFLNDIYGYINWRRMEKKQNFDIK